ncbi:MAG: CvpA family protein [Succinivibrio sp.]|nr:CvpA family protein [Succinivibrio sp.]
MILTALDWVIIAVVAVSAFFSIMRGFVKEAVSLLSWIIAFVVTGRFYGSVAAFLTFSNDELTRNFLAIILLFIATLILVGLVGKIVCSLVVKAGLSGFDRLLGIVFGVVRGVLILCAVLAVLQILFNLHILTFLQENSWWQDSVFRPDLEKIVSWFFRYMSNYSTVITGA